MKKQEELYFDVEGKTVDEFCDNLKKDVLRRLEFVEGTVVDVELGSEFSYGDEEYPRIVVTIEREEHLTEKMAREEREKRQAAFRRSQYELLKKEFEK